MFEFYVRFIWPMHRLLVQSQYSKRCKNCGASEKMIPLKADGRCELCHQYKAPGAEKTDSKSQVDELNKILSSHQKAGAGSYDALCLFSGGKDSLYLVQRIRNECPKLRMLAMTIDNSFMSPVAKEHVEESLNKIKIDHIFVKPSPLFYKKLFRYCLTHLNSEGGYGTLDFSDGEFLLDTARNIAAEKKIPLILCGYSKYQVQNGLKIFNFEYPREKELENRVHTAGLQLTDIFEEDDIQRWWQGKKWPAQQVPRLIFPLYAWDLEESFIRQQVIDWGLGASKQYSPMVTNHQLIPLIGVVDVHKFGYSSFEPEFCRMIREGKAKKEEWQYKFEFLEYISKSGLFVKKQILQLLKDLDLTTDDVGIKF